MEPNWKNQTIWTRDNLYVMRGMNSESVDLIYLDPPFNSNRTYAAPIGSEAAGAAFKDTWTLSDVDEAWHGEIAEQNRAVYVVIDAAGEAHGKGMKSYLIMMAVRLLEMRRLLKDTGSIYLHCDSTASHYLKLMMDAVFGQGNFRSEITWRRTNAKGLASKGYPNNADALLYYSKTDKFTYHRLFRPHDPVYVEKFYRYTEPETGRRYQLSDLTNPNLDRPNLTYEFLGINRVWRWTRERMQAAYDKGLVVQQRPGALPRHKRYLDEMKGIPIDTIWDDIKPIQSQSKERVGYPTQKPLALLDRIIRASTNEGDMVLDPFAGCATACVASERLGRQWVGIDISEKAAELVQTRIRKEIGRGHKGEERKVIDMFRSFTPIHRTDIPQRTDLGELPPYRTHKHRLYGKQEGRCGGCNLFLPYPNMTIDHIVPRSKGGPDHLENLQLLCGACNSLKGDRPQSYLKARLKEINRSLLKGNLGG